MADTEQPDRFADDPPEVNGSLPDAPCPRCKAEGEYLFTVGVDAWFRHCGADYSKRLVLNDAA